MTTMYEAETPPVAGAYVGYNATVKIAGETIARIQRFSFTVNNNIEQVYVVSSRTPLNVETNFLIRGTIRRLYINSAMLRLVIGRDKSEIPRHGTPVDNTTVADWMGETNSTSTPSFTMAGGFFRVPEMTIVCELHRDSTEDASISSIELHGVKFNTYDFTVDANAVILENITFFAEKMIIPVPQ